MAEMEIDNDLACLIDSSLKIHEKKRRASGTFKNINSPELLVETDEAGSSEPLSSSPDKLRRSSRKKFKPLETEKRRTYIKPKKLVDATNLTEVYNYYVDKKVKRLPPTLETIFEEPQEKKDELLLMSSRKFKRCINFTDSATNCKLKSRRRIMKAKKVTSQQRRSKKISMDFLLKKLETLSDSDS